MKRERLVGMQEPDVEVLVEALDVLVAVADREIDGLRNREDRDIAKLDLKRLGAAEDLSCFAPAPIRRVIERTRRKDRDVRLGRTRRNEFAAESVEEAAERAGNIRNQGEGVHP